jgi:hypothetical protein
MRVTDGHTGGDVLLFAYGPSADRFVGAHENTEIAWIIADIAGLDMAAATEAVKDVDAGICPYKDVRCHNFKNEETSIETTTTMATSAYAAKKAPQAAVPAAVAFKNLHQEALGKQSVRAFVRFSSCSMFRSHLVFVSERADASHDYSNAFL